MMADASGETEILDEHPQHSGLSDILGAGGLAALAKNPKFQSILQRKMREEMNFTDPYDSLPKPVKLRARALKNLQVQQINIEAKFYEEVQMLEAKYQSLYQSLFDQREKIVSGTYEPTADETTWADSEDEDEEDDDKKEDSDKGDKMATSQEPKKGNNEGDEQDSAAAAAKPDIKENGVQSPSAEDLKGIPDFWLTALQNVDLFSDYIMSHDEPILKLLTDIILIYKDNTGMDFDLEFHFADNDFFTNKVLTKQYKLTCAVMKEDPFSFEGATITKVTGCKIDWKKGKNITVKTIKKKQKHKGKNQSRTITKTVPNQSFFSFFSPPDPTTFQSKDVEEVEELALQLDEDIGRAEFLRDRLIPKAVLFFTGEALKDEDDEDDDIDDCDDDDDDDDSDVDCNYNAKADLQDSKPPECKNQ